MESKIKAYVLFIIVVGECGRGEGETVVAGTTASSAHGAILRVATQTTDFPHSTAFFQ